MNRKNRTILRTFLIISIVIMAVVLMILIALNNQKQKTGGEIGRERDRYGCLVSAGYSWDDSVGACLREWELDESQRQAARLAVAPLSFPVTIVEVQTLRCPGCFIIKLQRNDNQNLFQIKLANWTYQTKEWNCSDYTYYGCPDECVVCPSCEFCSSVSCQTEESCKSLGFNREWYDSIKKALEQQ